MMYVAICHAKSTSACAAATANGDDIECTTFTAKLRDPVKPAVSGGCTLTATDKEITVQHDDVVDGMTVDQDLILARHVDGYWFVIKWVCNA